MYPCSAGLSKTANHELTLLAFTSSLSLHTVPIFLDGVHDLNVLRFRAQTVVICKKFYIDKANQQRDTGLNVYILLTKYVNRHNLHALLGNRDIVYNPLHSMLRTNYFPGIDQNLKFAPKLLWQCTICQKSPF